LHSVSPSSSSITACSSNMAATLSSSRKTSKATELHPTTINCVFRRTNGFVCGTPEKNLELRKGKLN
jgi:hypothetical protein